MLSSFFLDILGNLIGALIGAALAIPTGLWIDRKTKERNQRELDNLAIISIRDELITNLKTISEFVSQGCNNGDKNIPFLSLSNDSWKTAQALGAFSQTKDYKRRKSFSEVYAQIEYIKTLSDALWSMFFSTRYIDPIMLERKLQVLCKHLLDESKEAEILIKNLLSSKLIKNGK